MICASVLTLASVAHIGPFKTAEKTVTIPTLDSSNRKVDLVYPVADGNTTAPFRLVSYLHGLGGGGILDPIGYYSLFRDLASMGYVVLSPRSCDVGCKDDRASLKEDPPAFAHFYKQQLKTIDWAVSQATDEIFRNVDFGRIGIAGHSMGGQGTLFSASGSNSSQHNVTAAVLHHAYSHAIPSAQVPSLIFTGTTDETAHAKYSKQMYEAVAPAVPKGIVNRRLTEHWEPITAPAGQYHKSLGLFTAAWFKVYVDETPTANGFDFEALLFGNASTSLCGGGDGRMEECKVTRG